VPVQRSGPGEEPAGPAPLKSFDELSAAAFAVPPFVLANVKRCRYDHPTPIQAHAVPLALVRVGTALFTTLLLCVKTRCS
jgi:superfamily II DNA/RNA helicase